MPTYVYLCQNCGHKFERFQSIKAAPLTVCPACGKATVKRIITGGTGLIFKGSGFYITDYARKSGSVSDSGAHKTSAKKKKNPTPTEKPAEAVKP